jgi:polyisoprenoid-binding protein YceI
MNKTQRCAMAVALASMCLGLGPDPAACASQAQAVDAAHSKMTVRVFKSGVFSAFAHDHEIDVPIESGGINSSGNLAAELHINARTLQVEDPGAPASTRAEIQKTMLGPQVLDSDRFPEIHFKSTSVELRQANHWSVRGVLELHGQSQPVTVDVMLADGLYRGTVIVKQSAFGIAPIRIAGGTVKVKDEVRIDFAITVAR